MEEPRPGILIVEADPQMSWLLETILAGSDRQVFAAGTVAEAHRLMREKPVELVVLDFSFPDDDGRDFLAALRKRAATAALPVIVLSGLVSPAAKAECYAQGADTFFEKPVAPEILKAAVSARLRRSIEQRREERRDPLTGLPNREAFREGFRRLAFLAERRRDPAAFALVDFDHLASINEAHGYEAGDAALRHAAGILEKSVRQSDFLARWDGGAFTLMLPSTSLEGARRAVSKVLGSLRKHVFRTPDGKAVHSSFSAGVVPVMPKADIEAVMAEADHYLRQAKAGSKKRPQPRYTR